jgi:hypothetical protein
MTGALTAPRESGTREGTWPSPVAEVEEAAGPPPYAPYAEEMYPPVLLAYALAGGGGGFTSL